MTAAGGELCDDGNLNSLDGCSSTCTLEAGFTCTTANPSVCTPICGDSRRVKGEACDDGNSTDSRGCSNNCLTMLPGYYCSGGTITTNDICTELCADGRVTHSETCDDNNTISGDGCSSLCVKETGFTCTTLGGP